MIEKWEGGEGYSFSPRLFVVSLFFAIVGLLTPLRLQAADYDPLLVQLEKDDWESVFLGSGMGGTQDSPRTFSLLVQIVNNVAIDWRTRIKAIRALGATKKSEAAEVLSGMFFNAFLNDECPAIKTTLVQSYLNFPGNRKTTEALFAAFDDREVQVREAAAYVSGMLRSEGAIPFLLSALKDRSFAVRMNAVRALVQIGDSRAVPHLRALIEGDADPFLRQEAGDAILRLEMRNSS